MGISLELARFIKQLNFESLPDEVVLATKNAFLDWLGSAAAGAQREPGRIVLSIVEELGGKEEATLISTGEKTSSILAAMVNGAISHIVELDDVHKASIIHAGAPIIPAALAAVEKIGAGGRELIEGIVAGYEVAIRIGEAVTPAHYYYWHTTATVGTFGAAAAAGKILGLSEEQLVHTLGTAGTQAAGLWEFLADGAMSKHLHPGKAALNGLLAALLARQGFTGASRILEGEKGFVRATAKEYDLSKITNGLGQSYKIVENCIKIHASCRHTHHAIDLVLDLVKKHGLTPAQIAKIIVRTYPIALDLTGNYQPDTLYAAKFSLPFCVALAAKQRKAGLRDFNELTLVDPSIRTLMSRVELIADQEVTALYPAKWPAIVEITDLAGQIYTQRTDYPAGDPENPISQAELEHKFRELASSHFGVPRVEMLVAAIRQLEDITNLSGLLGKGKED
ncbi:MmgE/PrpD family protein [Desulfosporosinus sp. BICA1-9]|uniref:MmgE/PrpD family protein n=1 Tax=Desulfosporosinus sp. BICA1-9 TaxID=1531958 RepID=UPI00054B3EDB|nr:MmgE/PrpD family protein [Desulfosporosinus sp. BICA1-9]KJS46246.1 MAG: 2-methylcitrate dehydratase [Peptococcaceae bacterium BRH_c23]KJS87645.1 MAG: 2-methylcitrate dehydratase [Desulfosporosinus sp. BICA1-9]HBW33847.1 MmgE/PrpD family protein [Desulfosporosinus sp.]